MVQKKIYHLSVDCARAYQLKHATDQSHTPQQLKAVLRMQQKGLNMKTPPTLTSSPLTTFQQTSINSKENNFNEVKQHLQQYNIEQKEDEVSDDESIYSPEEDNVPLMKRGQSFDTYRDVIAKFFWSKRTKHETLTIPYVQYLMLFNKKRRESKIDEAIAYGVLLVVIHPKKYSSYQLLANLWIQSNEWDLVNSLYKEAVDYHSTNESFLKDLAQFHMKQKNYPEALKAFDDLLYLKSQQALPQSLLKKYTIQSLTALSVEKQINLSRNSTSRVFSSFQWTPSLLESTLSIYHNRPIHSQRVVCLLHMGLFERIVNDYELYLQVFPLAMVQLSTRILLAMLGYSQSMKTIRSFMNHFPPDTNAMITLIESIAESLHQCPDKPFSIRLSCATLPYESELHSIIHHGNLPINISY